MLVMTWELFIEAWVMLVLCTRKGLCGCKPEQGKHCNIQDVGESDFTNATCSQENDIHSITMENQTYQCVSCYFPNHCLEDNECAKGTTGPTCEKCDTDYYRIGSSCVACKAVPWSLVVFLGLSAPVTIIIGYVGFLPSIFTKLKLLINFLQFMLVTLSIRQEWTESSAFYMSLAVFGNVSPKILNIECYVELELNEHFCEWITLVLFIVTVLGVGFILDKKLEHRISTDMDVDMIQKTWLHRNSVRRACTLVMIWIFMPVASCALHSLACGRVMPNLFSYGDTDLFLFDQSESMVCYGLLFQVLNFILVALFLGMVFLGLPILLFFTVTVFRWKTFKKHYILYGSVYESYKDQYCFWEVLPLLRKFVCVLVTEIYPVSEVGQTSTMLCLTLIYLLHCMVARPYKKCSWQGKLSFVDIHNTFEILANVSLLLLHAAAFIQALLGVRSLPDVLHTAAVWILFLCVVIWALILCLTPLELAQNSGLVTDWEIPSVPQRKKKPQLVDFWTRNAEGEGVDYLELKERQNNLDF